ncbi:MAG TPA: 2-succinyl-5-enolpyruvyl-6-hydroxy-3-cyclohexene-1-carboxylic-acid synthase [Polyangiaceae bacterium]
MTAAIVGEWARLLLGSLAQAGVSDVVVSPGSRSTPFAWAAAGTPGLRCHALYDERSAGFFALGLARVTNMPALLLCTSGSAAANYFPAVVEASLAHVPLLVLTADRPLELQDVGAPQTIDQVKLYGDFARRYFDLGLPDAAPDALAALRRIAAQACFVASEPAPGPVHLNARARKPLEPSAPHTEHERAVADEVTRLLAHRLPEVHGPLGELTASAAESLHDALERAQRGIIVVGPLALDDAGSAEAIRTLGRQRAMPVFAEATSQLRFGAAPDERTFDALDWVFRSSTALEKLWPDTVLRFGATPTSGALERLLAARRGTELLVVSEHAFSDPSNGAAVVVRGGPERIARLLSEDSREQWDARTAYVEAVAAANAAAWSAVDDVLGGANFEASGEALAVRAAVDAIPPEGLLVLGNSLPIREVDAFVRASARSLRVLCQRGTNGIDGIVSGAAGSAFASGSPALVLLGDVSFAHDLSGLAAARLVTTPFVIVVLDNDGGRIFEQLPVERLFHENEALRRLWLTPPGLALEHAAGLFGLRFAAPGDVPSLREALGSAMATPGATVVHVRIAPEGTRRTMRAIGELVEARVRSALGGPG